MKTFLIVGAGRQATAVAAFLLEQFNDTAVLFADRDPAQIQHAISVQRDPRRCEAYATDGTLTDRRLADLFERADCVVSCVPYFLNEELTRLAIRHQTHFTDLGGNKGTVQRQLAYHAQAESAGISILPDSGLDPGLGNILAEYWKDAWRYRSVKLRCGGLPQQPRNLIKYQLTFSPWGLFNEYFDDCEVSRGGRLELIPGMSEVETIADLPLPGTFEAFATSGGVSVAAALYAPQGVDYEYKTIRYPGHRDYLVAMHELGLFDDKAKARRPDGTELDVTMRDVAVTAFERSLWSDRKDLVILRAEVVGEQNGRRRRGRIDLLDYADDRFTAMERTTGFPTAVVSALQAGLYPERIAPGAKAPFQVVPPKLMLRELQRAGITGITITESEL